MMMSMRRRRTTTNFFPTRSCFCILIAVLCCIQLLITSNCGVLVVVADSSGHHSKKKYFTTTTTTPRRQRQRQQRRQQQHSSTFFRSPSTAERSIDKIKKTNKILSNYGQEQPLRGGGGEGSGTTTNVISSPDSPMSDRNKLITTKISSGGATATTKDDDSSTKRGILPWAICFALSTYYCFLLFVKDSPLHSITIQKNSPYFKDGFCVTGLTPAGVGGDTSSGSCNALIGNSHQFAWGMDVLFGIAAMLLPHTGLCKTPRTPYFMMLSAIYGVVVIGSHGWLHRAFSMASCGNPQLSSGISNVAAYTAFVLVLVVMGIFGFSSIPTMPDGTRISIILSLGVTAAIVFISQSNTSVSAFFGIIQFLISSIGLFVPNTQKATVGLARWFILPNLISLLELSNCSNFLVKYGGHAYYDFFLHTAILVQLMTGKFD